MRPTIIFIRLTVSGLTFFFIAIATTKKYLFVETLRRKSKERRLHRSEATVHTSLMAAILAYDSEKCFHTRDFFGGKGRTCVPNCGLFAQKGKKCPR